MRMNKLPEHPTSRALDLAREALSTYGMGEPHRLAELGHGLINSTYAADFDTGRYVLQRVHPVFSPQMHYNIDAVTQHLHRRGVSTPRLVRTRGDALWTELESGVWRMMTRLEGVSHDRVRGKAQAHAAAATLAACGAMSSRAAHRFVGMRMGVHDTPRHLEKLRGALRSHQEHRLFSKVEPLGSALLEAADALPTIAAVPQRVAHGDPKFNNLLFKAGTDADAVGWIDLDTVGPMALHLELGDAWRSWCNPKGEDEAEAAFDLEVFAASLAGYASVAGSLVTSDERQALVHGVEWISLELASRFCTDALEEAYFGWDKVRFATRGEHNLRRAQGQWSLHRAALDLRSARTKLIEDAFA